MTVRAFVLGFLGAVFVCAFTSFNDLIIRQTQMIRSYMPVSLFGGVVLFVVLVNPLLRVVWRRLVLTGRELAVILTMTMAVGFIPSFGLMHIFPRVLFYPHHAVKTRPAWQQYDLVGRLPKGMLVDVDRHGDRALYDYLMGLHEGEGAISLREIPWRVWREPVAYWLPMILSFNFALMGLAFVVHRQWSKYELLPYPLMTFLGAMLPDGEGRRGPVLRSRLFWLGAGGVAAIHLNNYVAMLAPDRWMSVSLTLPLGPLARLWSVFERGGGVGVLNQPFYFAAAGLAYFLATDISFSLAVAPFLYAVVAGALAGAGVSMGGLHAATPANFVFLGGYVGVMLVTLYTGRHWFIAVFRASLLPGGRRGSPETAPDRAAVWGGRVFLAGLAYFLYRVAGAGIPFGYALFYVFLAATVYIVVARVVAETGVAYLNPHIFPGLMLVGLLGPQAVGADNLLFMMMITAVVTIYPGEALMPFMVQGLHLLETRSVPRGPVGLACVPTILVGLAVSFVATLYWFYRFGESSLAHEHFGWGDMLAVSILDRTSSLMDRASAQGLVEEGGRALEATGGWLQALSPDPACVTTFVIVVALTLGFYICRWRFAWWPLHPVMFIVSSTHYSVSLASGFLAGCLLKTAAQRYSGSGGYHRLQPLMLGLIAGEMVGGVVPMVTGAIWFLSTGERPAVFFVTP